MYIRRQCLDETGLFDADAFGKGYGEENDFCLRATAKGWKHKLACDVFVYHAGSVSFGEATARQQAAMRVLLARHPRYSALVRQHVEADPANAYRIAVTSHRIRNSGKRVFLAVTHQLGGGVAQHIDELTQLTAATVIWLTLTPVSSSSCTLECSRSGYRFTLMLRGAAEHELLTSVVRACGAERIHIHHLLGHGAGMDRMVQDLALPYDFTVHDYYAICPQINLSDEHGKYCGEPDEASCNRCLARRPKAEALDISSWRAKHAWLLQADRVIAPSVDAADRMTRYFPQARVLAAAHPTPSLPVAVEPRPLASGERLRVAVLGVMAIHKGLELLEQCAESAARSGLPLAFSLVGSVEGSGEAGDALTQTGRYRLDDLPALLERVAPHIVWFPARWPETFSYTLSSCLDLGLPVAAHDLGAFPSRVADRPWSWILPVTFSAADWIEFFLRIRQDHFLPAVGPVVPPPQPQAQPGFYADGYQTGAVPGSKPPGTSCGPRSIRLAAAVVNNGPGRIQACGYVRIIQPLTHPALADTICLTVTSAERLALCEADLVLVQRNAVQDMETAERIVDACRRRGSRLLFEIDDDLFHFPEEHPEYQLYVGRFEAAKRLARSADAVLVSTETLRGQMLEFNTQTIVLPNYLDDRLWRPPSSSRQFTPAEIRIVYVGTSTHQADLEFLGCAIRKLGSKYRDRIRLDVVGVADGAPGADWFHRVPVPPHIAQSYPRFVDWIMAQNRWHWGVAPLLDTSFNRSKSALKFLEYAALGLPSICSDMPVYRDAVRHEETGLLIANDPDCWRDALERAVADEPLWERLRQACPAVVSASTLAANAQTIKSVWLSLSQRDPANIHPPANIHAPEGVPKSGTESKVPGSPVKESLFFPALDSSLFVPLRYRAGKQRTWSGHLPFARDLVASLRPRLLVELGTHYGESYFGFCQSVMETGCGCACYAVDTWRGDPHSLAYGSAVFEDVERHNSERYAAFSHLLRSTFHDALARFSAGSIDLLHIDGLHTYAAVKQDWDSWFPKVAPGGIVLLHDIGARHADFGVWRLWEEIKVEYKTFEFHHYHGLGVVTKPGMRADHGGILDYLFAPENAEPIRRYYAACADRLDGRADAQESREPGHRRIFVDPAPEVSGALINTPVPDAGRRFLKLPFGDPDVRRNDCDPCDGNPDSWRAATRDPWIVWPATLSGSEYRYFVLIMSCSCASRQPIGQLYWSGPERPGFNETLSLRFPVQPDGKFHLYILDLHAGADPGVLNSLWWHRGKLDSFRLDPLDAPGEFTITLAGFAHQDLADSARIRSSLHLPPLRMELSYRYLRGSGIEIGALQNPLELRPDTYIRYADRLTLAEARAHYPELAQMALVKPSIICDAASLTPVARGSVDFVIANHVLEHLADPLGAIQEWLRVVRPGGHAYVAVPDHANPLDRLRPITPPDHLIADFEKRGQRKDRDREHYREWAASTRPDLSDEQQAEVETELLSTHYAIHFHTFSRDTFAQLMKHAARRFSADLIECRSGSTGDMIEYIAILRKS
jgi:glycosyltransferase involved in cell wall biosynthesis/SAM-dependent methyltransferase